MKTLKIAALWMLVKLLAVFVFVVTSVASCGTAYVASSKLFYPAQTEFPDGVPPAGFMVAVENREAPAGPEEAFVLLPWNRVAPAMAKDPTRFRLSVKEFRSTHGDPWKFRVLEEFPAYQVIELTYRFTSGIEARYRIEGDRIKPLFYRTDGGVLLFMFLMPVFLLCLWVAWVAARRCAQWARRVLASHSGVFDSGPGTQEAREPRKS